MKPWFVRSLVLLSLVVRVAAAEPDHAPTYHCDQRETDVDTGRVETSTILTTPDRDAAVEACRVATVRSFGQGRRKFYSVSPSGEIQFDADPGARPGFERLVIDRLDFEVSNESSYLHLWSGDQLAGVVAFHDRYRPSLGLNVSGLSWTWSCGAMELLDYVHDSAEAVAVYIQNGHVQYARRLSGQPMTWADHGQDRPHRFEHGSPAALELQFESQCAGSLREFSSLWF